MFCRNCGKALAEGAKFCTICGSPAEPGSVQPQGRENEKPAASASVAISPNQWGWNDQRNDPAAVVTNMAKSMGFVCEYES